MEGRSLLDRIVLLLAARAHARGDEEAPARSRGLFLTRVEPKYYGVLNVPPLAIVMLEFSALHVAVTFF